MGLLLIVSKSWILGILCLGCTLAQQTNQINTTCVEKLEGQFEHRLIHAVEELETPSILSGDLDQTSSASVTVRLMWTGGLDLTEQTLTLDSDLKITSDENLRYSPKEIRREGLFIKADEAGLEVHLYNSTDNCSYVIHTDILFDEQFFTFSLDNLNERLIFIADKTNEESSWWDHRGTRNPLLNILHLHTKQVQQLDLPMQLVPGRSTWNPTGEGLITIARRRRYSYCSLCPDSESFLVYIDTTTNPATPTVISNEGEHVSSPAFSNDGSKLAILRNKITDSEGIPVSPTVLREVVLYTSPVHSTEPRIVLKTDEIFKNFHGVQHHGFETSIFFLQDDERKILVNSGGRDGHQHVLVINMDTLEMEVIDRSVRILAVSKDLILAVEDYESGYSLVAGHLGVNSPSTELTTEYSTELPTTYTDAATDSTDVDETTTTSLPDVCQKILATYMDDGDSYEEYMTTSPPADDSYSSQETTRLPETTLTETDTTQQIPGDLQESLEYQAVTFKPLVTYQDHLFYTSFGESLVLATRKNSSDVIVYFGSEEAQRPQRTFSKFWLALGWHVLSIGYDLTDESVDAILENAQQKILQLKKTYDRIVLFGDNFGGTLALLLAQMYPDLSVQVVSVDGVMNLQSLLVYQPKLLSRMLGRPSPFLPTVADIVSMWELSPVRGVRNSTADYFIVSSGKWPRQSELFYSHTGDRADDSRILMVTSEESEAVWLREVSRWIFKSSRFEEACRLSESSTQSNPSTAGESTSKALNSGTGTRTEGFLCFVLILYILSGTMN